MSFNPIDGFDGLSLLQCNDNDPQLLWLSLDGGFAGSITRSRGLPRHIDRLSSILNNGGVQTVVCENRYYDEDFVQAYQARYVRALWAPSPQCKRLHFFGKCLDETQFRKIWCSSTTDIDPGNLARDLEYLGFLIIQPLGDYPLGRIMLSTKLVRKAYENRLKWNSAETRPHFSTAVLCEACLCGLRLAFECTPFVMPHEEIGVCAEDALWINLRTLHLRRALAPWISLSRITDRANETVSSGHCMPSQGLTNTQVTTLFRKLGLDSFVFEIRDIPPEEKARQQFLNKYRAILNNLQEGGMPVILKVKYKEAFHMLVLIGHTYKRKEGKDIEVYSFQSAQSAETHEDVRFRHFSNCTEQYIVHDPLRGPYELASLDITECESLPGQQDSNAPHSAALLLKMEFPFNDENEPSVEMALDSIIAANPTDISLDAFEAEANARAFYMGAHEKLPQFFGLEDLILRTILMHNTQFKEYIAAPDTLFPVQLIAKYRALSLPKWIYVTQFRHISTPSGYSDGEIVIDATTKNRSMCILSVHYKGWLSKRDCTEPRSLMQLLLEQNKSVVYQATQSFQAYRAIGATDGQ